MADGVWRQIGFKPYSANPWFDGITLSDRRPLYHYASYLMYYAGFNDMGLHHLMIDRLPEPVKMVLLAEGTQSGNPWLRGYWNNNGIGCRDPAVGGGGSDTWTVGAIRHTGGYNVSFCDGHAKWVLADGELCTGELYPHWQQIF